MATRVNVTSIEAIEIFRSSLIVYLSKAKPALEEISSELNRTRVWVESTQRMHWDGIFKRRARQLEEANAALFSSRMSTIREASAGEQLAVTKAKRLMAEAEDKIRMLKRWDRDFENQTAPLARQLEKLQSMLTEDLVNAVAYLSQSLNALEAYAGLTAPSLEMPLASAGSEQSSALESESNAEPPPLENPEKPS